MIINHDTRGQSNKPIVTNNATVSERGKRFWAGTCFSNVTKLFGPISGATEFSLYLRNAEVLSHQTSQSSWFSYIKSTLKEQLFKISGLQFVNWLFGFVWFFGLLRNAPQVSIVFHSSLSPAKNVASHSPCHEGPSF